MGAEIDRLEIAVEASASKANQQLDILIKKLNTVSSALGRIDTSRLGGMGSSMSGMSKQYSDAGSAFQKLSSGLQSFTGKANKATKKTKNLAAAFGTFYANSFLAIRGIKKLGSAIESSMDYIETYNYFKVTMDKIGSEFGNMYSQYGYDSAEAYVNSFSNRMNELTEKMTGFSVGNDGVLSMTDKIGLGLDPEAVMNFQASIAAITNSVGLMGENSINASKALTMLSADLSSLKNIDLDKVMTNLQSGLIGQSRALYKYGIDITNNTLQTYAYANGINKAVSEMTQAEKMQLRLVAILDQSRVAWGDQANTINSVANQYRILKQQVSNLARIIGNLLMPVVQKVLPVINGMVIALQRLFAWIGNLLGIDWSGIMDGISSGYGGSGLEDLADSAGNAEDALKDANKAAEKFRTTTLGIDELNINSPQDSSGSSSGYNSGIDLSGAIGDLLSEYESVWDKAFADALNKAQEYADKICAIFKKLWDLAEPTRKAIANLWNNGLKLLGQFTWDTIKDFWNNFLKPVGTWMLADNAGLPRFFNITNDLLMEIDWERLRSSLADFYTSLQNLAKFTWTGLMDFYDSFLKPVAVWAIGEGLPRLVDIFTAFNNEVDWSKLNESLNRFWEAIAPYATQFGEGLIDFFEDVVEVAKDVLNWFPGGLDSLSFALENGDPEKARSWGYALGVLATGFLALKGIGAIIGGIATLGNSFTTLSTGLGALFGSSGIFATIGGAIGKLFTPLIAKLSETFALVAGGAGTLSEAFSTVFGASLPVVVAIAAVALALADLWNTSETFRDSVGIAFAMVKDSICNAFENIKSAISPLLENIKELGTSLYGLYESSGLKRLVEILASLAAVILGIVGSAAIQIISSAISGLITVLSGAVQIITGFVDILTGLFTLDAEKISEGLGKIGEGFLDIGEGAQEFFTFGIAEKIQEIFSGIAEWMNSNVIQPIIGFFRSLWEKVSGVFAGLWSDIVVIWGVVSSWFNNNVIVPVVTFFTGFAERVKQIFEGLWIIIQAIWIVVTTWVNENIILPLVELFTIFWEFISNLFLTLWEGIQVIWSVVSEWFNENIIIPLTEYFRSIWTNVKTFFTNLWSDIKKIWISVSTWFKTTVIEPVKSAFQKACESIGGFFDSLWSGIKKGVVGAMNTVITGIESGINFIVNGINQIIAGFNKVVSWAAKVAEIDWGGVELIPNVSLPRIQAFTTGGFPESYSMFMAGENGVPEILGTVGGRTAVASGEEITGIREAVYDSGNTNAELLRTAIDLLSIIADKDLSVELDGRTVVEVLNERKNRNGYSFC